jgi:hypothetical protein
MSNQNSNGKTSFKKGQSDLIFQIPAMNSTLIPQSVRLVGKLNVYKNMVNDATSLPDDTDQLAINSRLGVYGAFQSLTLRSIKHQQTIESIRHYPHMLKSYLPLSTKLEDNYTHLGESALTIPNWSLNKKSVVNKSTTENSGDSFAVAIPCGVLNGVDDIPLPDNMLGGLEIKLELAPDSQFLFSLNGDRTGLEDAFYEFTDLKLICEVKDYPVGQMPSGSGGVFNYQSISSYYDTINSGNANIVFNLGLSKVRSAWVSFVPSKFINSLENDAYSTLMPMNKTGNIASVKKITWTKAGALYPYHMELNNVIRDSPKTIMNDPVVIKEYVSAVLPWVKNKSNMLSVINTNRDYSGDSTDANSYMKIPNSGVNYGIGVNYDALGGEGADFSSQLWGLNMELDLNTDNPNSAFIFVNSEQSVAFNNNGIQVIQ